MSVDPFYITIGLLFAAGLLIAARHELDERRWRREKEAEDSAHQAAE
jgi:hypothetical protein